MVNLTTGLNIGRENQGKNDREIATTVLHAISKNRIKLMSGVTAVRDIDDGTAAGRLLVEMPSERAIGIAAAMECAKLKINNPALQRGDCTHMLGQGR
jgi:hypothetical protein